MLRTIRPTSRRQVAILNAGVFFLLEAVAFSLVKLVFPPLGDRALPIIAIVGLLVACLWGWGIGTRWERRRSNPTRA